MTTTIISSGVTSTGFAVSSGDVVSVMGGGVAAGASVLNGGVLWLASGALVEDGSGLGGSTTISPGGVLSGDGRLSDHIIVQGTVSGHNVLIGVETILGGGRDVGSIIQRGANQTVASGAVSVDDQLEGNQQVSSGGSAYRTVVALGGEQQVVGIGAYTLGTTVELGGLVDTFSRGVTSNTIISGVEDVRLLAVDHRADVRSGGLLQLISSGSSISAIDRFGGTVSVFSGGIDIATSAHNGGAVFVGKGGVTSDVQVLGGGERVLPGGTAIGTVVSGGLLGILPGGTASGLTLSAGGQLNDHGSLVMSGTHALFGSISGFGAISETSGTLTLSGAGSAFTGTATIDSGTLELARSDALGTGAVIFNGGTLQLDAAPTPGGTLANTLSAFAATNDAVDLRGLAFSPGASASASGGVLTVSDGGHAYKFNLAGAVGSSFSVTSDGHGGTLIEVAVAGMAQAAAAMAPTGGPSLGPVAGGDVSGALLPTHATASVGRG